MHDDDIKFIADSRVRTTEETAREITAVILKKNGRVRICFSENVTPNDIFFFVREVRVVFLDRKNQRIHGNPIAMYSFVQLFDSISLEINREIILGSKKIKTTIRIDGGDTAEFYSKRGRLIASHKITKEHT